MCIGCGFHTLEALIDRFAERAGLSAWGRGCVKTPAKGDFGGESTLASIGKNDPGAI